MGHKAAVTLSFPESIRDPIHGLIPLTACERELLRTRPLSRLRGVRQMGMAYVVYPGAHHTRFEHVIGAMHTAWTMARELPIFGFQELRLLRLAALTHDLGHRPFSHSLEDAAKRYADGPGLAFLAEFLDHEDHTRHLLLNDPEIGEVLARHPDYKHVDREELAALAVGEHPRADLNLLIHGEIDADRIDYVMRDNYYCGFAHGIDAQALAHLWALDATHGLVIAPSHVHIASQLLAARYQLIAHIQNSPPSRLGDLLLAEAIKEALTDPDEATQQEFRRLANEGQDVDMEHFLKARAGQAWGRLTALVAGREPAKLVEAFEFPLLSPAARYAVAALQQRPGSLPRALELGLRSELEAPLMIDVARVSAPVAPVRIARRDHQPWHGRLTDHPMVAGIVNASIEGTALKVYGPHDASYEVAPQTFAAWVEAYRAIDPSMSLEKAEHLLAEHWKGERHRLGLLFCLERIAVDRHRKRLATEGPVPLDALFLTVYAALQGLERRLGETRLYLDGREAVWALLKHPEVLAAWGEAPLKPYRGEEVPGRLRNELQLLRQSGLLYVTTRLERSRNVFVERHKIGATGWGRRLAQQLTEAPEAQTFRERLALAEASIFAPAEAAYRAYFGLHQEDMASAKRRELRRQMPIPVSR